LLKLKKKKKKKKTLKSIMLSGVVVHTCHPNAWEAETGESQVGGQPGLLNQILSQTNKQSTIAL
jgi:hypothetical protein